MTLGSLFFIAFALLGIFVVVIVFWLLLLYSNKRRKERLIQEQYQTEDFWGDPMDPEDLFELHREAFVHEDFNALEKLAKEYHAGAIDYWKQTPEVLPLIAQAMKKLVELVEAGNAPREPELEDFYYTGLMYEQGFECEPDLNKALEYFEKALTTKTCWSHLGDENKSLRIKVEKELRQINSLLADIQFKQK